MGSITQIPIDQLSDDVVEKAYREWSVEIRKHRESFPVRRRIMDTKALADELQAGGITLSGEYMTALVKHRDAIILIEIPWDIGALYAMSDIVKHAAFLLARMRTHSPKRVRVHSDHVGEFSLSVVE